VTEESVIYPIDLLDLPSRVRNVLVKAGLTTPEDLMRRSDEELLALHGFGPGSLKQVRKRLVVWEQEHQAEAEAKEEHKPESDPFPLLPGRWVLHAAWLPAPVGRLFLWGEGEPPPGGDTGVKPQTSDLRPRHPFHAPPPVLCGLLPHLIPVTAEEVSAIAYLPVSDHSPQPSPQLIRHGFADEPAAPEALDLWQVDGLALPPGAALTFLNNLPRPGDMAPRVAPAADLGVWSLAAKLVLELLARQQFAPTLVRSGEAFRAAWVPVFDQPQDLRRVEQLARAMPPVGRAVVFRPEDGPVPEPSASRTLLKDFLGATMDAVVRKWAPALPLVVARRDSLPLQRWLMALFGELDEASLEIPVQDAEWLHAEVARWLEQLMAGAEAPFRICFRLEPPERDETRAESHDVAVQALSHSTGSEAAPVHPTRSEATPADTWTLRFLLQARDDPSLLVPASLVWREQGSTLRYLDRRFENPQEKLLAGLGQAANIFLLLESSLRSPHPEACYLNTEQAYAFLREAAPLLEHSGFGVLMPQWWKKDRRKRLGVRATISPADGKGILNLDALVRFRWQLAIGDKVLDPEVFANLAALKQPLVQVRGEWVELQPEQVEAAIRFWEGRASEEGVRLREALQMGLVQEGEVGGLPIVGVETEGWMDDLLRQLGGGEPLTELSQPDQFEGQLRPYQLRGFSWLDFLRRWGLGACLADDMGLGKTVQAIALFLHDLDVGRAEEPVLVVCPTSVLGNWRREIHRFAPSLDVLVHHGSDRVKGETFADLARQHHVVITTYALARRDVETLRELTWTGIVLDEAQNIKNPATKQTQAIRRLKAGYRVGLTGTPVENRLSELWSIMQFLNPGHLGSQKAFRERFVWPIERYQERGAAARLRKLVQPFVLRRVKTDPTIIQDLPEKMESKVYCTLTPEQATLYQATVEDAMLEVEEAEGIQRRGLVLSMLTKLKQICNHPVHFLKDGSALPGRSGKLARLGEMLEEVLSVDERTLVFTQYTEMGTLLRQYLQELFGGEVLFLHGGMPAKQRDRMVARFQEEAHGPAIFLLSLRAGGLGLNLTRANHVFHFDRWWNPAVEDQATDRAFRIGQMKDVWVHKFVCIGTLEERIDELIESKKALAESVIGTGEAWLTELDTDQLRDIVRLSAGAIGD
jgi:SNF2 family DNA or RNA helicase